MPPFRRTLAPVLATALTLALAATLAASAGALETSHAVASPSAAWADASPSPQASPDPASSPSSAPSPAPSDSPSPQPQPVTQRASLQPGSTTRYTLALNGLSRSYLLHVPTSVPAVPTPLVIVMHGRYQTMDRMREFTGFDAFANRDGVLVAYAGGYGGSWNAGTCCAYARDHRVDDVAFLDSLIEDVAARAPLDRTQVSLIGFSNGGMMAYRYACQRSSKVASIAVVSATMVAENSWSTGVQGQCSPTSYVNTLVFHGLQDHTVPYQGASYSSDLGTHLLPVVSATYGMSRVDCPGAGSTVRRPAPGVVVRDLTGCHRGGMVERITVDHLGHVWSRDTQRDHVDTSATTWSFVRSHASVATG